MKKGKEGKMLTCYEKSGIRKTNIIPNEGHR